LLVLVGLSLPTGMPAIAFDVPTLSAAVRCDPCEIVSPGANSFTSAPWARFDRLTTEDGLSQNTVTSILQDSQGFMWFGTANGLNKYDGRTFTVYRYDPDDPYSLRDDSIMALYEDPTGVLWVGTQAGWLERYERDTGQFAHYYFDTPPVLSMYQDREGLLWVATGSGIYRLARGAERPTVAFTSIAANTITEDRNGVLWFGTNDGWLHFLDRAANKLRPVPLSVPVENYPLTSITEDGEGALWIGRDGGGLSRFNHKQQPVNYRHDPDDPGSLADDSISSIYRDRAGTLWIGTMGGGLDRLDPGTERFVHYQSIQGDPYSLSDGTILSLHQDRSGVLWIGTLSGGLNRLDPVGGTVYHYRNIANEPGSLGGNVVLAIHQDREGILWIGTRHGLDRFDRETGEWQHYRHDPHDPASLSHNLVWAILEDSAGTLWIGTQAGLDRYDGAGGQDARFLHYIPEAQSSVFDERPVRLILEEGDGTLLVASSDAVFRFSPQAGRFERVRAFELSLSWDRTAWSYGWKPAMLVDRAGALWVGTPEEGLYRLLGGQLTQYRAVQDDPESLSSNSVTALFEGKSGTLWIGTEAGLDRFDRETETFAHFRVEDGLPSNEVRGILPERDEAHLWISTVSGLSRFDPDAGSFRNYDVTDGLQGSEFNVGAVFRSEDGELFFGGVNGLNAFYPELIAANAYVPPVVIVSLRLFDEILRRDLVSDEQITLSYQENSLSFEFAALDYHAPEKNQYAYRMEGLDENWTYAGTRHYAEYRDLNPGAYVFRIRGANNTGVWNDREALVHITITPPFWETWWFRGLVGFALMGIVFAVYRLRVRGIEARSRELERQIAERTAELQRQVEGRMRAETALRESDRVKAVVAERNRIARELHDSVAQALYAVTLYADAASRRLSTGQMEIAREDVRKLAHTAKDALGEMRLLIFELRPPILDEVGLSAALQARLETVEKRSGLKTEFRTEGMGQLPCDVEDGFYRIAVEGLNNILKHAHASRVTLSLHHGSGAAALQLADDGVGFDPAATPDGGGMGLTGMAERAEEFGGHLTVSGKPGEGTVIRVEWEEK
jgi:signal transduction histidine kinase/streptogramin lyase